MSNMSTSAVTCNVSPAPLWNPGTGITYQSRQTFTFRQRQPSSTLETSITFQKEQEPQLSATSLIEEINVLLEDLQKAEVRLGERERICEYLLQFPDLIEVIPQAVDAAQSHLPEARLFLEVYRDPEIEDQYLVLYARFQEYDESVVDRIEAAEREYLDLLTDKEGWLQLTTDFREPE
ncbi:MAG: hypothetical protein D6723_10735 [Acidobacteria bacterium]|nr:MAG: hypothetical protein D6723_10735 [Acidobacteriota bacterium]